MYNLTAYHLYYCISPMKLLNLLIICFMWFTDSKRLRAVGKRYSEILLRNKHSIKNCLDSLLVHVQTDICKENNFECMGIVVYIEKQNSYKDKQNLK